MFSLVTGQGVCILSKEPGKSNYRIPGVAAVARPWGAARLPTLGASVATKAFAQVMLPAFPNGDSCLESGPQTDVE